MSVVWVMCTTSPTFQSPSGIYETPTPAISTHALLPQNQLCETLGVIQPKHSDVGLIFFNFHLSIWHLEKQPTSAWNTTTKDCLNLGLVWAFSGEMFF